MANAQLTRPKETVTSFVVGTPITAAHHALKKHRAKAALKTKNTATVQSLIGQLLQAAAAGGNAQAQDAVTICAVYNATGDPINYVSYHDWNGTVEDSYPSNIGNAQWGVFVHRKRALVQEGSRGAVVYRITKEDGSNRDWMFAWDNPKKSCGCASYHAYNEIDEPGHFDESVWAGIKEDLAQAGTKDEATYSGCKGNVEIKGGACANYNAVICLEDDD